MEKHEHYLVRYAREIGKTTNELTLWDMVLFTRKLYLRKKLKNINWSWPTLGCTNILRKNLND